MKKYRQQMIIIAILLLIVTAGVNIWLSVKKHADGENRPYLVEIERISREIHSRKENESIDLQRYQYVKQVMRCETAEDVNQSNEYSSCIRMIDGDYYRFDYIDAINIRQRQERWLVNSLLGFCWLLVFGILIYIRQQIIVPFHKLEQIPYELSKGNLTIPLKEKQTKYFGKFIWGTNLLREQLETRRKDELELYRKQKTMLLSLTHDIKTPLSVIKLNAQALEKGLYTEIEKQQELARDISSKVDEIEQYVSGITELSRDDFLKLDVNNRELYLSQVITEIQSYYQDKLSLIHTNFIIGDYTDCIVCGDAERLIEVLQNLMENAIKYGDGKEIRLSCDREEDCVLLSVTNTGASLSVEEIPHIFDSFYRGTNTEGNAGSGLGLYICRKLMMMMHGDIYARIDGELFEVTVVIPMAG